MNNLNTLNVQFTSELADNCQIWQCSTIWHKFTTTELTDKFECDYDCAELIKRYLTEESAIAESLNVKYWFN